MSPEPGTFEVFYDSLIQHPGLLWLAAAAALAATVRRSGLHDSVRRYCIALGILSLTDAWLTTNQIIGIGPLPPSLAGIVPLFFVLAGDFRYLLVVTAGTADGRLRIDPRTALSAASLTLIVPILTQIVMSTLPDTMGSSRVMFLVYELSFTALALGLMRWHPSVRSVPWVRSVSKFVVLYYALWATADAIILATGSDLGFLLRVVPNVLYYGGLIAVIGTCAAADSTA